MKVMVVGGGGREHAIIKGLAKSPKVDIIYALPGNGGIAADATCVDVGAKDLDGICAFAVKEGIDYAVVAPDDPLAMGCVDVLQAEGIRCFGPDKKAAVMDIMGSALMDLQEIEEEIPAVVTDIREKLEKIEAHISQV